MNDTELLDKLEALLQEGKVNFLKFDGLRDAQPITLVGPSGRIGDFNSIREAIDAIPE